MTAWQPIDAAMMPHRFPALLINAVAEVDADHGAARCFATGLDGLQMIEAAAQAIAAIACARAGGMAGAKAPVAGMLVSVNGMVQARAVRAGAPLTIRCHTHHRIGAMSAHTCTISDGGDAPVMVGECQVMSRDPGEMAAPMRQGAAMVAGPGNSGFSQQESVVGAAPAPGGHAMLPMADAAGAVSARRVVGDETVSQMCFAPELPVFSGHFPGNPVVPGVYLLAAALRCAAPGARLIGVERAKWIAPLVPGQVGSVFTRVQGEGGRMTIAVKIGFQPGRPTGQCCEARLVAEG